MTLISSVSPVTVSDSATNPVPAQLPLAGSDAGSATGYPMGVAPVLPMFIGQPAGSTVSVPGSLSPSSGSASLIAQSFSPGSYRSAITTTRISSPRQWAIPDASERALGSVPVEWSSRHRRTAPAGFAGPAEALLTEIAQGQMSEDPTTVPSPGSERVPDDASSVPAMGEEASRSLQLWVASGLIVAGGGWHSGVSAGADSPGPKHSQLPVAVPRGSAKRSGRLTQRERYSAPRYLQRGRPPNSMASLSRVLDLLE